jgi:hypothetical protein
MYRGKVAVTIIAFVMVCSLVLPILARYRPRRKQTPLAVEQLKAAA